MSKLNLFGVVAVMLAVGLSDAIVARAQDITEFRNGYITFTNENPSLYYRVEFKPNLNDAAEWDGMFRSLRNIQSSDPEVTVPVGVFYRVVGRDTPWVAGTALSSDMLAGKTAYVNDEEVTGTMSNVGQQTVTPRTSAQSITQGYHDGTGSVAGDAELVPDNIRSGASIFGVGGALKTAQVPKTGQTTSARTGDDGYYQKGVAWPSPRFTDHGNGTVTDNLTGLMWVKAPHALTGNSGGQTWYNAIDFCNNLALAGQTDWRLPNVRELQSLIDYIRYNPALPLGHPFTGVQSDDYWSSSTRAEDVFGAWYVHFYLGGVSASHKTTTNLVWPVRVGQ